ncbi:hypothetical protein TGAM01_v210883 [Trichoderma gamsii]|uniref:RNase H type-1 domain-containing protein n=1 Tax=Trichoderma gamsii TaxID=398673 RepID=A0A2P4Z7G8_9HYPO|nr:hypothetical protein TGAM01_v210883 [Trichoderma gamsii]PON20241.1 hypothetical protein TGAM01_v210883 [Trichoderma gamsii]
MSSAIQDGERLRFPRPVRPSPTGALPNADVYDAEAVGAFEGINLAEERIRSDPDIEEVILFLDNSAVVDGILGLTPASSQGAYMGLRTIAKDLQPGIRTRVAWVPGRKDIHGNETADKLAKEGSELPTLPSKTATITHIRSWTRSERRRLRELDWDENQRLYYRRWRLDALPKPPELQLPRAILHRLPICKYGEPRTQGHFVECRMVRHFLLDVPKEDLRIRNTPLTYLLGPDGYKDFQTLVEDTNPYGPAPQDTD